MNTEIKKYFLLIGGEKKCSPATFFLYSSGLCRYMAAASPFKGSIGLGYVNNWGRKDSNIFDKSETAKSREKRLIAVREIESSYYLFVENRRGDKKRMINYLNFVEIM